MALESQKIDLRLDIGHWRAMGRIRLGDTSTGQPDVVSKCDRASLTHPYGTDEWRSTVVRNWKQ